MFGNLTCVRLELLATRTG